MILSKCSYYYQLKNRKSKNERFQLYKLTVPIQTFNKELLNEIFCSSAQFFTIKPNFFKSDISILNTLKTQNFFNCENGGPVPETIPSLDLQMTLREFVVHQCPGTPVETIGIQYIMYL